MQLSWGRAHKYHHETVTPNYLTEEIFAAKQQVTFHAQGRSYGDVALNKNGLLVCTKHLKRFISADWENGVVRVEAGITLDQILQVSIPHGWFLPVTPGTKFVSIGGAVANDIHGKNHHHAGSFGAHITKLSLRRSNGETLMCSAEQNKDIFALTISGLGLTGFIEWVEFQMISITSTDMVVENLPFKNLDHFFEVSQESNAWPYSVAWVDCFATGEQLGRGIFTRGRHARKNKYGKTELLVHTSRSKLKWPFQTPGFILNKTTVKLFNQAYYTRKGATFEGYQYYDPFFYPLDSIKDWNKLYGGNGFYQHQSIIPKENAENGIRRLLETIARLGQGSFLAVLKTHGAESSPGRNSFCLEGTSLALDFKNSGANTISLLHMLDEIVISNGGRVYPAKDGTMTSDTYMQSYPNWHELENIRDPSITSSFWKRVTKVE